VERDRIYRHFCMMARALEVVGERWSLLIVRDLLLGPRRFTDLVRSLAEITPTRLTERLRRLEAAGLVTRDSSGAGREVWYRLTEAGLDLAPVVDALTLWGIQHAREPPQPRELVGPEPTMLGTKAWLTGEGATAPESTTWVWRFPGDDEYTLAFDGSSWRLDRGGSDASAVTVVASTEVWARFLTSPRGERVLPTTEISLEGPRLRVRMFAKAFRAELVD
jgi:DNA-binding HxlR family transcriptional regulator